MKILLISDLYPLFQDETIPLVLEDFALALVELGFSVDVIRANFLINTIYRKHKIFKEGKYKRNNITIYNHNFFNPFFRAKSDFLEDSYDLIISHLPCGHIYSYLINKKLKIPHIAILHNSDKKVLTSLKYKFYFCPLLKNALKNATLIGARNKVIKEKLKGKFILPSFVNKENIVLKKDFDKNKLRLITLSKFIKRKNIDLVIKALSDYKGDFEYNIYGFGKHEKHLKNLIKKYSLSSKIKINDKLNHDEIYEKLDSSDIFILPSVEETFGLSCIEAMSRGLITIASKNEGMEGIIKTGYNGFLIEPTKEAILDMLNKINSINRQRIVENTLLEIRKYEKEKIMNKYCEIIKKIYEK